MVSTTKWFLWFPLIVMGCGAPSEAPSSLTIVGGRVVPDMLQTPARRATFALTTKEMKTQGQSYCTAILIAPKVLLTAAHCVVDDHLNPLIQGTLASRALKLDNLAFGIPVIAAYIHSRYHPEALNDAASTAMNDIALLTLTHEAPNAKPIEISSTTPITMNEPLTAVGYGVTRSRQRNNSGRLRQVAVKVVQIASPGQIFYANGKSMTSPSGLLNAGTCAGDSGGPLYRKAAGGDWEVVGITSFGWERELNSGRGTFCTGDNGYVDIWHYRAQIEAAVHALKTMTEPSIQDFRKI